MIQNEKEIVSAAACRLARPLSRLLEYLGNPLIQNEKEIISAAACRLAAFTPIIPGVVIAHHIILTGYGHWLPNDPRGSLSRKLRSPTLESLGPIHHGRKTQQPSREALRAFHSAAKMRLSHQIIWFDNAKRQAVAEAFSQAIGQHRYTCLACAILTNHAHLLIRKHRDKAKTMIACLKDVSSEAVRGFSDVRDDHPIWSNDPYKKFVDSAEGVLRDIRYIENNPEKSNLPPQQYAFVKPYQGEWSGSKSSRNR